MITNKRSQELLMLATTGKKLNKDATEEEKAILRKKYLDLIKVEHSSTPAPCPEARGSNLNIKCNSHSRPRTTKFLRLRISYLRLL